MALLTSGDRAADLGVTLSPAGLRREGARQQARWVVEHAALIPMVHSVADVEAEEVLEGTASLLTSTAGLVGLLVPRHGPQLLIASLPGEAHVTVDGPRRPRGSHQGSLVLETAAWTLALQGVTRAARSGGQRPDAASGLLAALRRGSSRPGGS